MNEELEEKAFIEEASQESLVEVEIEEEVHHIGQTDLARPDLVLSGTGRTSSSHRADGSAEDGLGIVRL